MIKPVLLSLSLVFFYPSGSAFLYPLWVPSLPPSQDVKALTYIAGKSGTREYEVLSFWIKTDRRAYIRYSHGKEGEDTVLTWLGLDTVGDEKAFKASFPAPDNRRFYIIQKGYDLQVSDPDHAYLKTYLWENENPLADSTVRCPICAQDEKEAMEWMRKYFFR
jgi:hypothetical protein